MKNEQNGENPSPQTDDGSTLGSVASDIRSAASHKYDQAVTEVRAKADDARSDMADEVKDVANALRRASEELRGGSAQERTLGQIASSLADASESIRNKDLGEIAEMAKKVGRENPILFLGGAALLGFAASRYAKASGNSTNPSANSQSAARKTQVNTYMNEGNPNTQALGDAP